MVMLFLSKINLLFTYIRIGPQFGFSSPVFFAWVLMFEPFHLASDELKEKPYVTCPLHGQLGNQMHEIATTLAYAWDHKMVPLFPDLKNKNYNLFMNYERIFFRLDASPLPRPILHTFEQDQNFEKIEIPVKQDLCLKGYFQTWEYFHHHRDKILDVFSPRFEELNLIKSKHADLLSHPCTVGVHVRTFNKEWSKVFPFVGLDYYARAMSLFPSETLFVVFSDRINWCKHHFLKFSEKIIFIEMQDHIEDFILMSMLKHNIIGNSSYSWWAGYLNRNANKIVIAPSHFVHPDLRPKVNANMPDWIVLDIDYDYRYSSYPEDILEYDFVSSSIDTQ